MRTYAFDLVGGDTPVRLYTITRRDGTVQRLTAWTVPITIDGDVWTPCVGIKAFNVTERNDGTPSSSSLTVASLEGGDFDPTAVALGLYDRALLQIDVTRADDSPVPSEFEFYGVIGRCDQSIHGEVTFEARNPHGFPKQNLVPAFTFMCRHSFGDRFCQMPIMRPDIVRNRAYALGATARFNAGSTPTGYGNRYFEVTTAGTTAGSAPTFDYTIGNTTTDGGVTWTARNAWERAFVVDAVIDRHNITLTAHPDARDVDDWYTPGKIYFTSGNAAGRFAFRVANWVQSTKLVTTYLPIGFTVDVGDAGFIWPDCDKTLFMCEEKFSNAINHGGFPYFAGAKATAEQGA